MRGRGFYTLVSVLVLAAHVAVAAATRGALALVNWLMPLRGYAPVLGKPVPAVPLALHRQRTQQFQAHMAARRGPVRYR